jgi:hypothetical protein
MRRRSATQLWRSLLANRGAGGDNDDAAPQGLLGALARKQPALCQHWLAALAAAVRLEGGVLTLPRCMLTLPRCV